LVNSIKLHLREHKLYAAYGVDVSFTKPDSTNVRMTSTAGSLGQGWMFLIRDRSWLNGKKIRIKWSGYSSYAHTVYLRVYDGTYNEGSDTDFPTGSDILTKGAGLLQTVRSKTGTFSEEDWTSDPLSLGSGTQTYATITISAVDPWGGQDYYFNVDLIQLIDGSTVVYEDEFTDDVHMDHTGSEGDHGYCSSDVQIQYVTDSISLTDAPSINKNLTVVADSITLTDQVFRNLTVEVTDAIYLTDSADYGYKVTGIVKDVNSNPVSGATVWLFRASDKAYMGADVTGDDGAYEIMVPNGVDEFFLVAFKDGVPQKVGSTYFDVTGESA